MAVVAELIGAYSTFDEQKAEETAAKLPSLEKLTESVKIEDVEKWAKAISINPRKIVKVKPEESKEAEKKTVAEEAENQKVLRIEIYRESIDFDLAIMITGDGFKVQNLDSK